MSLCARFAVIAVLAGTVVVGCGGKEKTAKKAVDLPRTTEALFERNCATCHGVDGRGDGPAAYLLDPKPRDFRKGAFRLVSTDNGVATEEDIVLTITRGMPGTPMPPWPQLSDDERRGLAKHVLSLRRDELIQKHTKRGKARAEAEKKADAKMKPGEVLAAAKPAGDHSPEQLLASFVELCAKCHAEDGTGRDDPAWRTSEGHPIKSRNFKAGVFKGGRDDVELYRRIAAGMPGTPMPAFGTIPPEQIWKMVTYIQSLSDPAAQEQAWVRPTEIAAKKVSSVPKNIGGWNGIDAAPVTLFPLWEDDRAVTHADVRVAYSTSEVGVLLEWKDPTRSTSGTSVEDFSDGAAIQFSAEADPPLFAMGAPGRSVTIWHWKGLWEAEQPPMVQGPAGPADTFYSDEHGWMLGASIKDDDSFHTGRAANNPTSANPKSGSADELIAEQFGTLTPRPRKSLSVSVVSQWADGTWKVLFRRDLKATEQDGLELGVGATVSVAFAIWEGDIGDRDGKKSVTVWRPLRLGGAAR